MREEEYWKSLLVWDGFVPVRKVTLSEALEAHPGVNPVTLDRDRRRAWLRLVEAPQNPERLHGVVGRPMNVEQPKDAWKAGIDLDGAKGTITLPPMSGPQTQPNFDKYLRDLGFDPKDFEILEPFHVRCWDAQQKGGKIVRLWYYRANIIRRKEAQDRIDVADLIKKYANLKDRKMQEAGDSDFVVVIADPQFGKPDGDGVEGTYRRFRESVQSAVQRVRNLRNSGVSIGNIQLISLGDLIENTSGHYAMQTFGVKLNKREQEALAREAMMYAISELSWETNGLHVSGVAGNHPENRQDGKLYTSFGDNADLSILDQLKMVVAEAPALSHVHFTIPQEDLELIIESAGTKIGIAHGHQMGKGGGGPEARVQKWWEHQVLGRQEIGNADILLTGHLHHMIVKEVLGRWWFQAPALESCSDWVKHTMGAPGTPGVLTFVTKDGKWSDMQVL